MRDEPERDANLERAVEEWSRGDFYEAHETLEDVADALEDQDDEHAIALALVRIAASLHKLANDVGASAVPAKLRGALDELRPAPPVWRALDLARLRAELEVLLPRLASGKPPIAELPRLHRAG